MSPVEIFFSAPPISRTLAAITCIFSTLIWINVLPYGQLSLSLSAIIQLPPEIWRIFTSLLITGSGLEILFDTYFLYVYGARLEIASPRFSQRADFVTYICFNCVFIVLANLFVTSGHVLAGALALAFVTTASRDSWGVPMTFIVIKMPSQYLPYVMLFLTLIIAGPQAAMIQATGFAAAQLYDFMSGLYPKFGIKRNLIPTPRWMTRMFGTQNVVARPYGTAITAGSAEPAWGLDLSWKRFGPGHTLGGEGSTGTRQRPTGAVLASMVMGGFLFVCALLGYIYLSHNNPDGAFSGWFSSIDDTQDTRLAT